MIPPVSETVRPAQIPQAVTATTLKYELSILVTDNVAINPRATPHLGIGLGAPGVSPVPRHVVEASIRRDRDAIRIEALIGVRRKQSAALFIQQG
jgi:hypothetical protein